MESKGALRWATGLYFLYYLAKNLKLHERYAGEAF